MNKADKEKLVKKYGKNAQDTGASSVQVAILSEKIKELTEHLKINKKDNSSRRGLIAMVNKRRKLLNYLRSESLEEYNKITDDFKIRRK